MLSKARLLSAGVSLAILWTIIGYILFQEPQFDAAADEASREAFEFYNLPRENFIAGAMNAAINDAFDYSHIQAICDHQQWDSTVVFTCHGMIGGIGTSCWSAL
jgi:hypothetical protein